MPDETDLEIEIQEIFHNNRDVYGTRKIKKELAKKSMQVSRRRIGRIMKKFGLVSAYTIAMYKPSKTKCNNSATKNELAQCFDNQDAYAVVVSELTYAKSKCTGCCEFLAFG